MENNKFCVLDAFRGLAALVVVQYHIWPLFGRRLFPHGYLAVDFFFLLSGFVLTHSYQRRLDDGWAMRQFVETRIVRLYPLYLAGLAASVVLFAMRVAVHSPQGRNVGVYVWLLSLGVLFIPSVVAMAGYFPFLFPLNPPAWSLFYEMVINVCHARFGRRRPESFILGVVGVGAVALLGVALRFGSLDTGETPGQWPCALVRVTFAYSLGSLLSRRWKQGRVRLPSWPLLSSAGLVATFAIPTVWHRSLVDSVTVLVIFPAILLMGAAARPARWMVWPSVNLGRASYGIYVLHAPLVALQEQIWAHLRGRAAALESPWSGIVFLVSTVVIAILLDKVYDVPLRAWMKIRLERGWGARVEAVMVLPVLIKSAAQVGAAGASPIAAVYGLGRLPESGFAPPPGVLTGSE